MPHDDRDSPVRAVISICPAFSYRRAGSGPCRCDRTGCPHGGHNRHRPCHSAASRQPDPLSIRAVSTLDPVCTYVTWRAEQPSGVTCRTGLVADGGRRTCRAKGKGRFHLGKEEEQQRRAAARGRHAAGTRPTPRASPLVPSTRRAAHPHPQGRAPPRPAPDTVRPLADSLRRLKQFRPPPPAPPAGTRRDDGRPRRGRPQAPNTVGGARRVTRENSPETALQARGKTSTSRACNGTLHFLTSCLCGHPDAGSCTSSPNITVQELAARLSPPSHAAIALTCRHCAVGKGRGRGTLSRASQTDPLRSVVSQAVPPLPRGRRPHAPGPGAGCHLRARRTPPSASLRPTVPPQGGCDLWPSAPPPPPPIMSRSHSGRGDSRPLPPRSPSPRPQASRNASEGARKPPGEPRGAAAPVKSPALRSPELGPGGQQAGRGHDGGAGGVRLCLGGPLAGCGHTSSLCVLDAEDPQPGRLLTVGGKGAVVGGGGRAVAAGL